MRRLRSISSLSRDWAVFIRERVAAASRRACASWLRSSLYSGLSCASSDANAPWPGCERRCCSVVSARWMSSIWWRTRTTSGWRSVKVSSSRSSSARASISWAL